MTDPTVPELPVWYRKWAKALGIVAVTVATLVVSLATDGLDAHDWVLLAGEAISAASVAIVPNLNVGLAAAAKSIIAFLLQGLTVLAVVVIGGLTPTELTMVFIAAFAAIGVTALPNDWPPARLTPVLPGGPKGSSSIPSQAETRYPGQ
jgi:hypothetical protein